MALFLRCVFSVNLNAMKKILIATIIGLCTQAKAQDFSGGLKAGLSNTQLISADLKNLKVPENYNGFVGGAWLRLEGLGLFIQPELLLRTLKFSVESIEKNGISSLSNNLTYLDVPVIGGKKFLGFLRLGAGPNFQFLISKNSSLSNTGNALTTKLDIGDYSDLVVGAQIAAGLDVWKLSLDVRYDFSINTIGQIARLSSNSIPNVDFSTRAAMLNVTLAYRFFLLP